MSLNDLPITTSNDSNYLNDKQLETWEVKRTGFANWLLERGKTPKEIEGYAQHTVKDTLYRTDHFARHVWESHGFKTSFEHSEADDYMEVLIGDDDLSASHASGTQKALKRLFKYQRTLSDNTETWDPKWTVPETKGKRSLKDVFSEEEVRDIYSASLTYNDIPAYNDLSPTERDNWKEYLSMALGKKKSDVKPDDWGKVDNWKIPSLVRVSIDAALRPVEVERSNMRWVDLDNSQLVIPADESTKNEEHWKIGLGDMATRALENWIEQREHMEKYDDSDAIWLTRQGNPYSSSSLRYLVLNLCEAAGINTEYRSASWYSIRHATGTFFAKKGNIVDAQEQLRHTSQETTKKYVHSTSEERSDINDMR